MPSLGNETAADNHSNPHQREIFSAFALCKGTTEACPACVGNQAKAVKSQDEDPHIPAEGPWSEGRLQVHLQEQQSCSAQHMGMLRMRRFGNWLLLSITCAQNQCVVGHIVAGKTSQKRS